MEVSRHSQTVKLSIEKGTCNQTEYATGLISF